MTRTDTSAATLEKRSIACPACAVDLPLRLSAPGEEAGLWVCTRCERPFAGVYLLDTPPHMVSRVRFADAHFDTRTSPTITAAMRAAAIELADRSKEDVAGPERRAEQRLADGFAAVAVKLNTVFCPIDQPKNIFVHNLSGTGLGFVSAKAMDSKWIALEMAKGAVRVQMIGEVIHCHSFAEGIFQVGARFAKRLG